MTSNRGAAVDETLVRIREDASTRRQLQRGVKDITRDITKLGSEAQQALDRDLSRAMRKSTTETKSLNRELEKTGKLAKNIQAPPQANRAGAPSLLTAAPGGASRENRGTVAAGVAIRNLPAIGPSETLAKLTTTLGRFGVSLESLGVSALIVAPAIIGVSLAFDEFNRVVNASAQVLRNVIQARREVAKVTAEGTSEELRVARDAAQERAEIIQAELNQLNADRTQLREGLEGMGALGQALIILQPGPLGEVSGAIDELGGELAAVQTEAEGYTQALERNATALADAKEAEETINAAVTSARIRAVKAEEEARKFSITATTETFNARKKQLALEIEIQERAQAALIQIGEAVPADMVKKLENLKAAFFALNDEIEGIALFNTKQAELQQGINSVLNSIVGGVKALSGLDPKGITAELEKAGQEIQALRQGFSDKLADIERRRIQRVEDAETDLNDRLVEIRLSSRDDLAEAERDAQQERVDAVEDHEKEVARIRRRFDIDAATAIQNRDAVALDAAQRRRDEEIKTENEDSAERQKEIEGNLAEQRRTIDRALKEQTRLAQLRYTQQVRDAGIAAQRSVEVEQAKFNAELNLKVQAAQQMLGIEFQSEKNRNQLIAQGGQDRFNLEASFIQAGLNLWSNAIKSLTGAAASRQSLPDSDRGTGGARNTGGQRTIPIFHNGGVVGSDGLAFVKRGEVITNPARGQSPGGMTLNINFSGATARTIQAQSRAEALRQLDGFLVGMGAA